MYFSGEKIYSYFYFSPLLTLSIFLFFALNIVSCSLPQPKPVDIDLSSHNKNISKEESLEILISTTVDLVEKNNNDVFKFPFYEGSSFDSIDGYAKEGNDIIVHSISFSTLTSSNVRNIVVIDLVDTSKTVFEVWKRKVPFKNNINYKINLNENNIRILAGCTKTNSNALMDIWNNKDGKGIDFQKSRLVSFFKTKDKSKFVKFLSAFKKVYPNVNIKYKYKYME
jgi:hypothetical protein